ncbi:MAG: DUF92 domain-containing protein [Candidatus Thorarchaeota archaeon]
MVSNLEGSIISDFLFLVSVALALNGSGSFLAWRREYLRTDGAIAAFTVGMILFLLTPIAWIVLLVFFISSSLLSKVKRDTSPTKVKAQAMFEKGGKRDVSQVLANSLAGILFLLVLIPEGGNPNLVSAPMIAYVGAIGAATADTWATEIGTMAPSARWVLNPRRTVPVGTSGGISLLGTLAAFLGSIALTLSFFICLIIQIELTGNTAPSMEKSAIILLIGSVAGLIGSFVDSFLGATVQAFYFCPSCRHGTEKKVHTKCGGTETNLTRGYTFINNDLVNFLATASAGLTAFVGFVLVV